MLHIFSTHLIKLEKFNLYASILGSERTWV